MQWCFDPTRSYEENVRSGPFGPPGPPDQPLDALPRAEFLGRPVHVPFGIPAGPLPTSRHCAAAFERGFDVNIYKTVRSRAMPAHAFPNTLAVRVDGDLSADPDVTLVADADVTTATSISNSFGVPSQAPDEWQPDMARAAALAGTGQVLVGSCQGTRDGSEAELVADYARTAQLVAETGVAAVELNLSCPNEGTGALVCFDTGLTSRIASAVRDRVGNLPVILKIAYFRHDHMLAELVRAVAPMVDAIAAVNTLPARLVDAAGRQALPGRGREIAGVCGASIRWAGMDMVTRLARHRDSGAHDWKIIGVGGVLTPEDYATYRRAGADAVMAATGAMRDAGLGSAVRALVPARV